MSDDANVVTFHDAAGNPVGQARADGTGRWQRIPPSVAVHLFTWGPDLTREMVERNEVVALFRAIGGGSTAELWGGPGAEGWAKMDEPAPDISPEDALGAKFNVSVDAYVIKADGSIER